MLQKISQSLTSLRITAMVVVCVAMFGGMLSFSHHVAALKQEVESSFMGRAALVRHFMQGNISQVEVMRNRFLETYGQPGTVAAQAVSRLPEQGVWTASGGLGRFSGALQQPLDAELQRQMLAARSMSAQLQASLRLNQDAVWLYYLSARNFIYVAPDTRPELLHFTPQFYQRPYWQQAHPQHNPSRRPIVAGPYRDAGGKGDIITIAQPVYVDGRFLGLAGMDLRTRTLSSLLRVGRASGQTLLISENDHLMARDDDVTGGKVTRPPLSSRLLQWDADSDGNLWLSSEIVPGEMWMVHRLPSRELYWQAARESAGLLLTLLLLSVLMLMARRLVLLLRQLSKLTFHDALTGLANRRLLEDRLQQAITQAGRSGQRVGLLFIDLDKFKPVNDRHGHETGDWLLKQVAARMQGTLRDTDTVARVGGDEFVVLLPGVSSPESAAAVAEKLRLALEQPYLRDGNLQLNISSSIGVAFYPDHASSGGELLRFGDEAMYQAKKTGRNTVVVFEASPHAELLAAQAGSGLIRLQWHASYASGQPQIDSEHQQLFQLANALFAVASRSRPAPEDIGQALDELNAHLTTHFAHEEQLLQRLGFSAATQHAASHAALLATMQQLRQQIETGEVSLEVFVNFVLKDLLLGHLLVSDREFYPLLEETR